MDRKPVSIRTQCFTALGVTILVMGGAAFFVYHTLAEQLAEQSRSQQEMQTQLSRKLSGLESQLAALAAIPHPDAAAFDAAQQELAASKTALAQLNDRMTALEKRPVAVAPVPPAAPVPPVPNAAPAPVAVQATPLAVLDMAVKKGTPYTAELDGWEKLHPAVTDKTKLLKLTAASGLATDEALRSQLIALIDRLNAGAAPADNSIVNRINTHLAGLVTIKKQPVGHAELSNLRLLSASAPVDTLVAAIAKLPAESQPSFAPWLDTVRARNAALAELNGLAAVDGVR